MDAQHSEKLDAALATLLQRWGPSVVRRWEKPTVREAPHLATGFTALDNALQIGGLPRSQLTQLSGTFTSGMHTLALKVIASAHAEGDMAAYVDLSHTFDADYAARCGVDVTRLLLVRPTPSASLPDLIRQLIESGGIGVLVVDVSFEAHPFSASGLKVLLNRLLYSPCVLLFLMPETSGVNTSLSSSAAVCLHLKKTRWLRRRQEVQGYRTAISILKNKYAPAGRAVSVVIGFSGAVAGDGS